MQSPLVSAVVLCYNGARFVIECLEGVKAQNYPNLELIVNDDASTDDSALVIEAWLGRCGIPHRFLRNETNQGICRSLNKAMSQAHGKYISGMGADDVWLPGKLLNQVKMMERLPNKVGVVYSDALLIDEGGKVLPVKFLETRLRGSEAIPEGNVSTALWRENFIAPMTTLIRRECFDRVGLYDESLFSEDWDMFLRLSRCYDFAYSPEISAKYRMHGSSIGFSMSGRLVDDGCRICLKHLKSGQLDPEARRAAAVRLHALASVSFGKKSARHKRNLLQALKYRPSFGLAGRLLFACCGLDPEGCERVRSLLKFRQWT